MKRLTKGLCALALFASSGIVLADCPQIGGYTLIGHAGNNCTYASNKVVKLTLPASKSPLCPRFVLTDPNYLQVSCHHDARLIKCVCKIKHR